MSIHSLKPTFGDQAGYRAWREQWRSVYSRMTADIRERKRLLTEAHRQQRTDASAIQRRLHMERRMAAKMMGLLDEAKARWTRILAMKEQIDSQMARFPLTLADCRTIDFHFNKGSLEFPGLPMWVLKAKGETFYVHHVTSNAPWSTRELASGSTRGMMRFRNCHLRIDAEGHATIDEAVAVEAAQAA